MTHSAVVTPERASGFLSLPSTGLGKWSAGLLVLALVLLLLNNAVVMPRTEQLPGFDAVQRGINLSVFLSVVAAGACSAVAIVKKREHSWILFAAVLLLALALALNLGALLAG